MSTPNGSTPSNRPATPDGAGIGDSVWGADETGVDLDEELNIVAGHLNASHARLVDLTVTMIANPRDWRGPGVHTPELFLAWRTEATFSSDRIAEQVLTITNRWPRHPFSADLVPESGMRG